MTKITSKNNDIVKNICKLMKSSSERNKQGLFVIEGLRLCCDAIDNGVEIKQLLITTDCLRKNSSIEEFCEQNYFCYEITDEIAQKISDTKTSQGVFCVCKMLDKVNIFDTIKSDGKYIGLVDVQNPDNLGAVSRTAEALGLDGMIVSGGCDIYNPKALRASMGALMRFNCFLYENDLELLDFLKNRGITSYACVVRNSDISIEKIEKNQGLVCFIGNEANGLSDAFAEKCDCRVTIEMKGRAESLNAANAATIVMWEISK